MEVKQSQVNNLFYFSPKQAKFITVFWSAFAAYTLSYVIEKTGHVSPTVFKLIQTVSVVVILFAGANLTRFAIKSFYLRIVFPIYCFWLLTVISRGIHFDYVSVHEMLLDANYGIFLYFAPFLLLFPNNVLFYKSLFKVIVVLGISFLLYDILFFRGLMTRSDETQDLIEYFAKILSLPCGFILLTYAYHSNKTKLLAMVVLASTLLLSVYKARRGLAFITASILVSSYLLYVFSAKNKILAVYITIFAILMGLFYTNYLFKIKKQGLMGLIAQRGAEDTRTVVELLFDADMKNEDWIVGKGINGQYFCPDCEENQETSYRPYIETGYLQIILKGGIVMLVLYLLIAGPAVILGIFFSNNLLSKASGIWILISLISLYPATVNSFILSFLMVWISVGICYSKRIRVLSDATLKEAFHNPAQYVSNAENNASGFI